MLIASGFKSPGQHGRGSGQSILEGHSKVSPILAAALEAFVCGNIRGWRDLRLKFKLNHPRKRSRSYSMEDTPQKKHGSAMSTYSCLNDLLYNPLLLLHG
mmetsp:Transcript_2057/g.5707  ORF Transcript_2057/g.5707 Transcript_2057/m.5707 type:complete len:100 (+) Transcript_2057:878-1177(+)